jgi:acetylornithine deacetylase
MPANGFSMHTPDLMTMLHRLIAAPSVSSVNSAWDQSNARVIDLLAEWLDASGFAVERLAVPGHPGKFNLVASHGSGPDGLVLAGHTDTVPYDDNRWSSDPLQLSERGGRLYGLGTSDMKGFFALALEALREIDLDKLQRPLVVLATADEESSMSGAQALVDAGRRLGRHALIGEPTGLRPVRMHKGVAMEAIRLTGRSGHSSDPALGVSALEGMHRVLGEILRWRGELQAKYRNPLFKVPVPTLNLGYIHGGDNPNRICAHCELQIDIRPLPGMELETLRADMERRLHTLLEGSGLALETVRLFDGIPAHETPATAPIVQAAEDLTGHPAEAVAFGTEAPYFDRLGMQTLVLGPGDIDQAHQPDEYLALERIRPYVELLRSLIGRFCLTADAV